MSWKCSFILNECFSRFNGHSNCDQFGKYLFRFIIIWYRYKYYLWIVCYCLMEIRYGWYCKQMISYASGLLNLRGSIYQRLWFFVGFEELLNTGCFDKPFKSNQYDYLLAYRVYRQSGSARFKYRHWRQGQ